VIDASKAEDATRQSLEDSLRQKVESVECPSDQKVEKGATFECAVTLGDGQEGAATLLIRNDDADITIIDYEPLADAGDGSGE
jgi:Domain of unknown function (DUF4333)